MLNRVQTNKGHSTSRLIAALLMFVASDAGRDASPAVAAQLAHVVRPTEHSTSVGCPSGESSRISRMQSHRDNSSLKSGSHSPSKLAEAIDLTAASDEDGA